MLDFKEGLTILTSFESIIGIRELHSLAKFWCIDLQNR